MQAGPSPTSYSLVTLSVTALRVCNFPIELLYEIISLVPGQYHLGDVLLALERKRRWDATGTLFHVNRRFRCCALEDQDIWGSTELHPQDHSICVVLPNLHSLGLTQVESFLRRNYVHLMRETTTPYERVGLFFFPVRLACPSVYFGADSDEVQFELSESGVVYLISYGATLYC
ncbi:hypothetical protein BJV78DRAFT_129990 [Lactifluus subvellereus]|nr:hypothetical protein BJV78DRAFT_129990 [Lactifluus subvellereus]